MNPLENKQRSRFLGFILEASKLLAIAIVCLIVIGAAVIVSAKTGVTIPARWVGLLWWTGVLLYLVFKQHKGDLRRGIFWLCLSAVLAVHVTAFAVVLRAYQVWPAIWFMFIFLVEGPLVLLVLQNVVHPQRDRKHV
jgi:hypothetical protein